MQIDVTIKLEIPDGYEYVDFRVPIRDEEYVCADSQPDVRLCIASYGHAGKRIIIKKKYVFDKCIMKGLWLAKSIDSMWRLYAVKPVLSQEGYWNSVGSVIKVDNWLNIELPKCNYMESLHYND